MADTGQKLSARLGNLPAAGARMSGSTHSPDGAVLGATTEAAVADPSRSAPGRHVLLDDLEDRVGSDRVDVLVDAGELLLARGAEAVVGAIALDEIAAALEESEREHMVGVVHVAYVVGADELRRRLGAVVGLPGVRKASKLPGLRWRSVRKHSIGDLLWGVDDAIAVARPGQVRAGSAPSSSSSARLRSVPPPYWPMPPVLGMTRWQGTRIGIGLRPSAVPAGARPWGGRCAWRCRGRSRPARGRPLQRDEHVALEGRAHEAQVDREVELGPGALDVGGEHVAGALGLDLGGDDARADGAGHGGEQTPLVLLGEADAADARAALDDDEPAQCVSTWE